MAENKKTNKTTKSRLKKLSSEAVGEIIKSNTPLSRARLVMLNKLEERDGKKQLVDKRRVELECIQKILETFLEADYSAPDSDPPVDMSLNDLMSGIEESLTGDEFLELLGGVDTQLSQAFSLIAAQRSAFIYIATLCYSLSLAVRDASEQSEKAGCDLHRTVIRFSHKLMHTFYMQDKEDGVFKGEMMHEEDTLGVRKEFMKKLH